MGLMNEVIEDMCSQVRQVKETAARHGDSLEWVVVVYRGGSKVALVLPAPDTRDAMLDLIAVVAYGFDADLIAVASESWRTTHANNPRTGKPWEYDDLEDLALNHHGIEKGWVSEGVSVWVANRAGDVAVRGMPFRQGHNKTVWLEPLPADNVTSDDPEMSVGGDMTETLRAVMLRPSVMSHSLRLGRTPDRLNMTLEEMQAHSDAALAKALSRTSAVPRGFPAATVMLAGDPNTLRGRVLDKQLPPGTLRI